MDSSGLVASVALLEDGTLLAEYSVNYKKTHSQTLLPMLDEISKMVELDSKTVDAIAVAEGPGSFTGLRIGSATAKGLGLALGVPIIEVPTLAGMAFNLPYARGLVCPVMDARRQQVYNGIYRFEGGKMETIVDQRPIAAEDLVKELNNIDPELTREGVIFLGDGTYVVEPYAAEKLDVPYSFAPVNVSRQRASSVGALALQLYREGKYIPAAEHVPVYLRKSQAEQERDRKNAAGS